MYQKLTQQKFVPPQLLNCSFNNSLDCVVEYGEPLYLSIDLTHFFHQDHRYEINLHHVTTEIGIHNSNAVRGMKGRINSHIRTFIYDIINDPNKIYFNIVQTKDNNIYLHNKYEFSYVTFMGMRFEPTATR